MVSDNLKQKVEYANHLIATKGDAEQIYNALYEYGLYIIQQEDDLEYGLFALKCAKESIERVVAKLTKANIWALDRYCKQNNVRYQVLDRYYDILLVEGRHGNFDSYMLYLEKERPSKDQFYLPKRRHLNKLGLIQGLQSMLDDELDILSISMPPGTGKTTLSKFFISFVMGLYPKDFNLFFSHSADICRMYYDGVLSIVTNPEYTWGEIFPERKVTNTNAKAMSINIDNYKPFQNLQCGSRGSELAGKVRCNKFLMVDDLIGKQEEALNRNTLDKIWANDYATDALQRGIDGFKQVIIATRWSVFDPIGRLQEIHKNDPRAKFIAVPDIDPNTGESNFDYDFDGFSVDFFNKQAEVMDEITYRCLYKNEPIEREGLLYHDNELRRYLELPGREPDAIVGVCDTKSKGIDFMVLPVFYQYDNDFYLVDCICDDSSDFDLQYSRITNIIEEHNMQQVEFESNAGGDRIAHEVMQRLSERHCRCNVTTKPTETNKETRIIVNSDWIKKNVLFKDKEDIVNKSDYDKFMSQLLTYSVTGKVAHDDVPDALANFSLFIANKERVRPTTIIRGMF